MSMTDPVADMLTRIRNANMVRHDKVDLPASRLKEGIARILHEEGYIKSYKYIEDQKQGTLRMYLKYSRDKPVSYTSEIKPIYPECLTDWESLLFPPLVAL